MTDLTIHPATAKKAAKAGFALTLTGDLLEAAHSTTTRRFAVALAEGLAPALAVNLLLEADRIAGRHGLRVEQLWDGDNPSDFVAYVLKDGDVKAGEVARDPDLDGLVETLRQDGLDDEIASVLEEAEASDEEETSEGGSVVPDVFKKRYAEAGHPNHCGDWLATTLNKLTQVTDGKKVTTDLDRLETIANANDVAPERVDRLGRETNGWQGRYRMTVRNMLARRVAAKGFILIPEGCGVDADTELKAPKAFCEKYAPKVKAKADPKAAKPKNEGAGKASAKTRAKKAA